MTPHRFRIGDRVRSADPTMMADFLGTVVGFENTVVRAGDGVHVYVASTARDGTTRDYDIQQLVIVRGDAGWTNSIHPGWLALAGGAS